MKGYRKKKGKGLLALVLTASMLICMACGSQSQEGSPYSIGDFTFTPENYPKVGGSLAALPLGQAMTAAVLGIERSQTGEYIVFEGSTTDNYYGLVDGRFELLLAYEPGVDAIEYAKMNDFSWEMIPIGRDALVFIANKQNPVKELSSQQIREIYTGNITNWKEVGGQDAAITPYQRNKDSGSQVLFDKLIDLGGDLMEAPGTHTVESMIGLLKVVAEYDNSAHALGYTVYYYLTNMEKTLLEDTNIMIIDGVTCGSDTIRSGEYPYVNDFYVVIPASLPDDAPARVLRDWICSEQGQELMLGEGYVVSEK